MPGARLAFWLAMALGMVSGCSSAVHRTRPLSRLEAVYLTGGLTTSGAPPVAATRLYRDVLGKTLGSRCKMFPTDSQLFDRRAARCGAAAAALLGISRLYLETAAWDDVLPSLVADGRVRWLDLPRREDCRP